jgi:hypothetical protein
MSSSPIPWRRQYVEIVFILLGTRIVTMEATPSVALAIDLPLLIAG